MNKKQRYALVIYFCSMILSDIIAFIFNNPKSLLLIMNLTMFPLLIIVILFLLKDDLKTTVFDKRKFTVKQSIFAICKWFFIVFVGFIVIANITPLFYTPKEDTPLKMTYAVPLMIIPTVFIGPVVEELIFRRIILTTFSKKFNILLSILFTSILFAGWHMSLTGIPLYLWISFIISYSYYQTNRLFVPITLHLLWNLFSTSIYFLGSYFFE